MTTLIIHWSFGITTVNKKMFLGIQRSLMFFFYMNMVLAWHQSEKICPLLTSLPGRDATFNMHRRILHRRDFLTFCILFCTSCVSLHLNLSDGLVILLKTAVVLIYLIYYNCVEGLAESKILAQNERDSVTSSVVITNQSQ